MAFFPFSLGRGTLSYQCLAGLPTTLCMSQKCYFILEYKLFSFVYCCTYLLYLDVALIHIMLKFCFIWVMVWMPSIFTRSFHLIYLENTWFILFYNVTFISSGQWISSLECDIKTSSVRFEKLKDSKRYNKR